MPLASRTVDSSFSPQGDRVVTARCILSGSYEVLQQWTNHTGQILVWEVATGEPLLELQPGLVSFEREPVFEEDDDGLRWGTRCVHTVEWSPTGHQILAISYSHTEHPSLVRVFNALNGDILAAWPPTVSPSLSISHPAWSPDAKEVAVVTTPSKEALAAGETEAYSVCVCDPLTGAAKRMIVSGQVEAPDNAGVHYSPDGQMILLGYKHCVHIRSARTGDLMWSRAKPDSLVCGCSWSPQSNRVLIGVGEAHAHSQGALITTITGTNDTVSYICAKDCQRLQTWGSAWSPQGGEWIVCGVLSGGISLHNTTSGKFKLRLCEEEVSVPEQPPLCSLNDWPQLCWRGNTISGVSDQGMVCSWGIEACTGKPVTFHFFAEATADTISSITRRRVEKLLPFATFLLQCRHRLQGNGNICGYIAEYVLPLWTSPAERRYVAALADGRQ